MSILGENIKRLRNEKGWSLIVLSNKTEIPVSTLNGIEKGSKPSYDKIEKLSEVFDVSMVELTKGDTSLPKEDIERIKNEPFSRFKPSVAHKIREDTEERIQMANDISDKAVDLIKCVNYWFFDEKYDLGKMLIGDAGMDTVDLLIDIVKNRLTHYNNIYEKNNKK